MFARGKLRWTFHTIPQPGEFGYETWPKDAWKYSGGANAWAGWRVDDEARAGVRATGSAAFDFYGANRHGDNLFANTMLALEARHRRARVAFPGRQTRHLGPRFPGAAEPRDGDARRAK